MLAAGWGHVEMVENNKNVDFIRGNFGADIRCFNHLHLTGGLCSAVQPDGPHKFPTYRATH